MRGHKINRLAMALLMGMALGLPGVSVMAADAPPNDNFADATLISALPFTDSVDNTEATTEDGEPQNFEPSYYTVWYSFTPTTSGEYQADMTGSSTDGSILKFFRATGPGIGDLIFF